MVERDMLDNEASKGVPWNFVWYLHYDLENVM